MDIYRIIGVILFISGVLLKLYIEDDTLHFFFGVLMGAGIALLIRGNKKNKKGA